jgi:hypothetical protein
MQRSAASNLLCNPRRKRVGEASHPHRADVDLSNQCSYEILDVDDLSTATPRLLSSEAIAMRIELA